MLAIRTTCTYDNVASHRQNCMRFFLDEVTKAMEKEKKKIEEVKIVFLGAGAAGCSCARLLKKMGAKNIKS